MSRTIWLAVGIVASLIFGCIHTQGGRAADAPLAVETLQVADICASATRTPRVIWIESRQDLINHWQRANSPGISGREMAIPEVEWDTHGLLLIQMGEQPTGGYRLELAQQHVQMKNSNALVRINWVTPPANAFVSQVITNPCLWLKIQRGPYRKVVIIDQSGQKRASADLPVKK